MPKNQIVHQMLPNQLLGAFEPEARRRLDPYLEHVTHALGHVICEAGGQVRHAYFPQGAVLSVLTVLQNGDSIETANIGREGVFAVFEAMYDRASFSRCIVQLEGSMLRCNIEALHFEFQQSEHVRNLLVSYSNTLLSQVQQTAACNALHTVEQRICRWLLMMHDRAGADDLAYTHEFLAAMMGANRKSVTLTAQLMQSAGLISYRRGLMQIRDRHGIEKAACECYGVVKARFDKFLSPPTHAVYEKASRRELTP